MGNETDAGPGGEPVYASNGNEEEARFQDTQDSTDIKADTTIPSIHHVLVAIPPDGEDLARRFYRETLGLREVEKPANLQARGGVWFQTGNLQLHLGVDRSFTPATKAHVAFEVTGLAGMRGRLLTGGYTVADDEPLPGFDRFYVQDPFGNRVELLERR